MRCCSVSYRRPEYGLFVAGSDTGVGKTFVAAAIATALRENGTRVGVYKPVVSGCRVQQGVAVDGDAVELWLAAGRPLTPAAVSPQAFQAALAPHLAARLEGREVDRDRLRSGVEAWHDHCDLLLVEGAGGLLSPCSDEDFVADLAIDLGYPVLLIVPNRLGCINQALQAVFVAQHYRTGLSVAGIVLNDLLAPPAEGKAGGAVGESNGSASPADSTVPEADISCAANLPELARLAPVPVLCHVPHGQGNAVTAVDWWQLARG